MDGDNDFQLFADAEETSSPVPERKLKRLKKASRVSGDFPLIPSADDDLLIHEGTVSSSDTLVNGKLNPQESEEVNLGSASGFEEGNDLHTGVEEDVRCAKRSLEFDSGDGLSIHEENASSSEILVNGKLDSLASEEANLGSACGFDEGNDLHTSVDGMGIQEDVPSAKRSLEFDSVLEEFDGKGEDYMDKENGDLRKDSLEKKWGDSNGLEKRRGTKKKRAKSDYDKLQSASPKKRKSEKERRDNLMQLRAESQRLLRETRDAAFKPAPIVQRPISSILEKIRQRKLEVSKKSIMLSRSIYIDDNEVFSREASLDLDFEGALVEGRGDDKDSKMGNEEIIACPADAKCNFNALSADGSKDTANPASHENITSQMALDDKTKQAFRAPVDDTQDLIFDSQTSDSKDEMSSSPLEEVLAPSLLAMNLKLDSAPPDDMFPDEEDNDKENVDPHQHNLDGLSQSPKGDPVKAFVDDEAEEEDDSDNDLRFQDSEEDVDDVESEELNHMIVTGYEEKHIDTERRNELHQKWLQQQDAAGTENLLQRLKCCSKQSETSLLEEEGDEDEDDFGDEAGEHMVSSDAIRMNLKKIKEMIPQMFTDKDDVYVSSDDEETEQRPVKQSLLMKSEGQATRVPSAENESSREIFGRIKKLNIAPDSRRKVRTSLLDTLLIGGNTKLPSKPSFLGRMSSHSLPSSRKHGSSTVRSYIFERDDGSSRNTISMSEDSSDMVNSKKVLGENRPTKTASAKFHNSQSKSNIQFTQTAVENNSGISLYEILTRSSSHCSRDTVVNQTDSIFEAFKLEKKLRKEEHSVSVRTAKSVQKFTAY